MIYDIDGLRKAPVVEYHYQSTDGSMQAHAPTDMNFLIG